MKAFVIPNLFEGDSYKKLKANILGIMQGRKDQIFDDESDPSGVKWAPLKNLSRRNKKNKKSGGKYSVFKGKHKILSDTGMLRNSLGIRTNQGTVQSTSGDQVTLGTNIPYAAIQNFGGTIEHPGTTNGFGRGIKIKPHLIVIPARPFMGIGATDLNEVQDLIGASLRKAFK